MLVRTVNPVCMKSSGPAAPTGAVVTVTSASSLNFVFSLAVTVLCPPCSAMLAGVTSNVTRGRDSSSKMIQSA